MSTRTLRQNMPVEVWDRLAVLAREAGVPIGVYTRDVLVAHAALPDDVLAALHRQGAPAGRTHLEQTNHLLIRKFHKP